jgi:peptidoglycan L-alanyl-D-glutamate endopeptidase CwlK
VDRTEELIQSLAWYMQDTAYDFVNAARVNYRLPLVITSALRSPAQQQQLVRKGLSQTLTSKHLDGLAFDVDLYGMNRNSVPAWVWSLLGPLGESMGLTWGGRWKSFRDVGHFER